MAIRERSQEESIRGDSTNSRIRGVTGVSQDVTDLKHQEDAFQAQNDEHQILLANEAAARQASQLKSQFLANVSRIKFPC
jgi:hypothetical protein